MRAWILGCVLVACGARTGLRTGTIADGGTTTDSAPDVTIAACPTLAQVAQTGARPDAIAIDGDFVYWHDDQGVSRVHKSGGAVEHVASSASIAWPDLSPFAVAGGHVFFADDQGTILRVPVSGGPAAPIGLAALNAGFAASTAHAYFWSRTSGPSQVTQVEISGQSFAAYDIVPEPPSKLRFDGDAHAIAAADPGVFDVHQGGHQILNGLTSVDLVFDQAHVWFTSDDATNGARVMTLVLSTLATTPIADTAGAFAIERDDVDLFFTDRKSLRVRRVANRVGPVTDVALSPEGFEPVDLALDGACVFWTSAQHASDQPGAIMVAPKP